MDHTKIQVLIEELDNRFGNKYAPKHYKVIQEAALALRNLIEENRILTDKELSGSKDLSEV